MKYKEFQAYRVKFNKGNYDFIDPREAKKVADLYGGEVQLVTVITDYEFYESASEFINSKEAEKLIS